jgi:hypothetical protein
MVTPNSDGFVAKAKPEVPELFACSNFVPEANAQSTIEAGHAGDLLGWGNRPLVEGLADKPEF